MSRTENSVKSVAASIAGSILRILIQFVSRSIFISVLGQQYLGVNGLFTNILQLLGATELGIGTGFVFSLYKPMAENNQEKIKSLLQLYKKAYLVVSITTLVLGLSVTPFLEYFVAEVPDIPNFRLIYVLSALNTPLMYFMRYRRSVFTADQKQYIVTGCTVVCNIALHVAITVGLLITKNYIFYLLAMLAFTFFENALVSLVAGKRYPYIKEKNVAPLSKGEKSEIIDHIKALIFSKLGMAIISGTAGLLITKLFGLMDGGIYSNYLLIITALTTTTSMIFDAVAPSIGNLNVTESPEAKFKVLGRVQFFTHWLFGFCSICLLCLFNPFITLWVGGDLLFPMPVVTAICVMFYLDGMRRPMTTSRNAMGLHVYMRYMPVVHALAYIALALLFSTFLGIAGIFVGASVGYLVTTFWSESVVMYKKVFFKSPWPFFTGFFCETAFTALVAAATYWLCSLAGSEGILTFALKMLICAVVPNLAYTLKNLKNPDFIYFVGLAKGIVRRRLKRK